MSATGLNRTEKRAAITLASIFGLRMLGLFLIMPVLAIYGQSYPDYTPFLVGIAIGAYGLAQAFLQIPMGWLSDRIGRRPVILGGLAVFAIGSVVAAMADTMSGVIWGRVLQGAGAIAGAVLALAADSAREEQRPKVMAVIGMGIGLSFVLALIIAPLLGGIIGMSGLFWMTAALAVGGILLMWRGMPVTYQQVPSRDVLPVPKELKRLLKHGQLMRLNFGVFVLHLVLTAWFVTLPLQLVDAGLAAQHHSWLYLPTLILSFAVMVPMMIILVRRKQQVLGMRLAMIMLIAALASVAIYADALVGLIVGVWVFFIGFNYLEASLPAMLTQHAPAGSKGSASGIYTTAQFAGAFLGGVIGGFSLQKFGATGVIIFCIALLVCWLLISMGLQQVLATTRMTYALAGLTPAQAATLSAELTALGGIEEAIVIADEGAVYLKVQRENFDAQAIQGVLARYQ
ncbi:MFS transporter [Aliidiomarina haloalkalitolerans]|uniref:MFS transporter n=1 Tax=Aliidiomarina haloalkalitolerans TaxID=859059 RepID=A0A432VPK0_9GAMM|nr:MFS transporter [Aliidiomarina haloalkalitolerans]RUO18089.1 MFS transporter [Aliidiomarina haloalkalitolerans]